MATINKRELTSGRIRYWVQWRLGGTRDDARQSEPFDVHADAYTFKLHAEAAGFQAIRTGGSLPLPNVFSKIYSVALQCPEIILESACER